MCTLHPSPPWVPIITLALRFAIQGGWESVCLLWPPGPCFALPSNQAPAALLLTLMQICNAEREGKPRTVDAKFCATRGVGVQADRDGRKQEMLEKFEASVLYETNTMMVEAEISNTEAANGEMIKELTTKRATSTSFLFALKTILKVTCCPGSEAASLT